MPWYEPANGAPTPLAVEVERSDEAEVDNYLDEGWNYHPTDDSRNNRRHQSTHNDNIRDRLTLDGFQHQVENQLSGIFPLADFSSSLEYTRQTYLSRSHYAGNDDERKDHRNINSEGTSHITHSKAAQFFHPRPVMALMPYKKDFFSPLTLPSGGQFADVDENRKCNDSLSLFGSNAVGSNPELMGYENRNNLLRPDASHRQYQYTSTQQQHQHQQYQQQQQIQQLHHRQQQQCHPQQITADDSGSDRMVGKISETSQSTSFNEPTSNLKPKQLNNLFDSFVAKPSNDPFQKPPRQSKLIQDSTTGELVAKSTTSGINPSKHSEKMKTKSWDEYGGRPMDGAGMGSINNSSESEKAANAKNKKKDKKKKSKDKNQKHPENMDIGQLLQRGTKRPSNQSQQDDGVGTSKDISNAAKSNHRSSIETVTELGIPSYNTDDMPMSSSTDSPEISEKDFDGIERMELQNAAQCMEGLQQFLALVGRQKHVAFTTLFLDPYTGHYFTPSSSSTNDPCGGQRKKKKHSRTSNKYTLQNAGFECTTPFLPTSKKYCTPKGPACSAWNCTCDDQIRGMRASAMLLGAMFVFQSDGGGGGGGMGEDGSAESGWQCFLLPLGPTASQEEVEYERMSTWPTIPFQCDVSLSDRWHAFEALLLNGSTKLVTYNATLSLLPYYYHLDNDVAHLHHASCLASFASCIAGSDLDGSSQYQRCYLRSVWDLRLASWMLRPEADDATLEFRKFQEGFAHLARDQGQNPMSEMPIIMQGLTDARSNLELIHTLFPIMNEQLSNGGLLDAFECIETPVQSILASMESRGIGFFPHRIKRIEVQIESRVGELETQSRSITNDPEFLLSSPQQVSSFLFDVLKLRVPDGIISKTKSGSSHRSTSEEALQGIKSDMVLRTGSSPQMIDIILEFRQLNKLLTTFVRPLPKICRRVPSTRSMTSKRSKHEPSRIYPQWMQTAVRTGRLSCRKPNLQQIPKEGGEFVLQSGMLTYNPPLTDSNSTFFLSIWSGPTRCIRHEGRYVPVCL